MSVQFLPRHLSVKPMKRRNNAPHAAKAAAALATVDIPIEQLERRVMLTATVVGLATVDSGNENVSAYITAWLSIPQATSLEPPRQGGTAMTNGVRTSGRLSHNRNSGGLRWDRWLGARVEPLH